MVTDHLGIGMNRDGHRSIKHGPWVHAWLQSQGGGITVTPKTSDVVVVSPQAGNCFDMAAARRLLYVVSHGIPWVAKDMIPPVRGNAYVLVVPLLGS